MTQPWIRMQSVPQFFFQIQVGFNRLHCHERPFTHTHNRTVPQHSSDHSTDHGGMQPQSKKTLRLPFYRLQSVTGQDRRTHARNHRRGGGRGAKTKLSRKKQTHRKQWTTSIIGQHYPCAHQQHMQTDKLQCRTSRLQGMMRNWFVWTLSLHLIGAILFPKLELQAWSFNQRQKIFDQHNGTC